MLLVQPWRHNRAPFVPVKHEYKPSADVRGPQKDVMVNPRVLEYETLVAVNQLKLHRTATSLGSGNLG
jgi:hypothetical protein